MNLQQYKIKNNDAHSILVPSRLYEHFYYKNSSNSVSTDIPEELLFRILNNINDCIESFQKSLLIGVSNHLNKLSQLFYESQLIPLPTIDFIIQSGIIPLCVNFLFRDPLPNDPIIISPAHFLAILSQSSPDYLKCINLRDFLHLFQRHLRNTSLDHLNHYLFGIWNCILSENTNLLNIFKEFDMELVYSIIQKINTQFDLNTDQDAPIIYSKDELSNLIEYNKNIFQFIQLITGQVLDSKTWFICFDSISIRIHCPFLAKFISRILFNLILYKNEDEDDNIKHQKFQKLTSKLIIQFVQQHFIEQRENLFLYYIHFLVDFQVNESFLFIPIEKVIATYFEFINSEMGRSQLTLKDNLRFTALIHNLICFYKNSYIRNQEVIKFTRFLFNEKIRELDYFNKEYITYFVCDYIFLDSDIFFTEIANYSNFMQYLDEFICDFNFDFDISEKNSQNQDFVYSMMNCLIAIYNFFTVKYPNELNKLVNSECIKIIQHFILRSESNDTQFNNPVALPFLQIFPIQ